MAAVTHAVTLNTSANLGDYTIPTFTPAVTMNGGATTTTFTATTYLAAGSNPATAGSIRMPNNNGLYAHNAANNANVPLLALDGSNNMVIGDNSATIPTLFIIAPTTLQLYAGGGLLIEGNGTGLGFFGSTPNAKPTVSGSRAGNAALNDLCSELANLGLITNSTSP